MIRHEDLNQNYLLCIIEAKIKIVECVLCQNNYIKAIPLKLAKKPPKNYLSRD